MPDMPQPSLIPAFLGVLCVCAVIVTATMLLIAVDLRRTLRQANRTLARLQRILVHATHASRRIDAVVEQACAAASGALHRLSGVRERVVNMLQRHAGNGSGLGPRRRRGG